MSYKAITDIIVNPSQIQDLQLSNSVKDSPKSSSSVPFSDFLMSYQNNEVSSEDKPQEIVKKNDETVKQDDKKESVSDAKVEKGEKTDNSEKVAEKNPAEETKDDSRIAEKDVSDAEEQENIKNPKADANKNLVSLEKTSKPEENDGKNSKKLSKKDFSRLEELTGNQGKTENTDNVEKQIAAVQNLNEKILNKEQKADAEKDNDFSEILTSADSSDKLNENLIAGTENQASDNEFNFSQNNQKKEFALDKDGKITVEDLRTKVENDSDSDKKSVLHTSDIKLTGENTAVMSVELNPNAEADVLSLNTQTAAADGSNFQAMLSNQLHNVAPEFVKAGNLILKDNNQGTINLILHPDDLGNVKIHLSLDGKTLSGQITVATKEALQVFKDNAETLREAFIKNGFDAASFDVAMNNGGSFNQNMNFERQDDGRNLFAQRMYGSSDEGLSAELDDIFENAEDISNYSVNIVA